METYKYTLDRSSKKFICPACNKKTFVKYIETETKNYIDAEFGKCDRQQNCNYHKAPPVNKKAYNVPFCSCKSISNKAYKITDTNALISIVPKTQVLDINKQSCWITEWYLRKSLINYKGYESKYFSNDQVDYRNVPIESVKPPAKPSFHKMELLENLYVNSLPDNLTIFLNSCLDKDEVKKTIDKYFITGTNYHWPNATIFWQIDEYEQIHAGKIMLYSPVTGKRIKEPCNHINWLHKAVKEPDFNLNQCLFGLHLISSENYKPIAIVESEKTAVIMSIYLPKYVWMATGSKSNLKAELLKPLKKRKIVLFPDKGEFENWNLKATDLNTTGFKIAVSNLIEEMDFENGCDLADLYLSGIN